MFVLIRGFECAQPQTFLMSCHLKAFSLSLTQPPDLASHPGEELIYHLGWCRKFSEAESAGSHQSSCLFVFSSSKHVMVTEFIDLSMSSSTETFYFSHREMINLCYLVTVVTYSQQWKETPAVISPISIQQLSRRRLCGRRSVHFNYEQLFCYIWHASMKPAF